MSIKWRIRIRFALRLPLHVLRFWTYLLEAACTGYEHMLDSLDHDLVVARKVNPAVESEAPATSPAHWRRGPEDDQAPFFVPPS